MATHDEQIQAIDNAWACDRANNRNRNPGRLPQGVAAGQLAVLLPDRAEQIDPAECRWVAIENIACDVVDDAYPGADYFGRLGLALLVVGALARQADGMYHEQLYAVPTLTQEMRDALRTRAEAILSGLVGI